jgi:nucleoside-diphosphate-sugar epimerase
MRVLVTGGAGYKGVLLTEQLLDIGHQVEIFDNFMYGYSSILHLVNNSNLTINKKDIRNIEIKDIKSFDVIFHLSGISGMPACAANPHSAETINVESTHKLTKLLSKNQILINASTTSFYGYSDEICDEKNTPNPVSIYGKTKWEAEKIVQDRENSISLRFATVFGVSPKMRNDLMVNDFTYKALYERSVVLFGGDTKRTFVHINDAIRGYLHSLENFESMKNQIFNVGSDNMNFSKSEIANYVRKYIDFEIVDSKLQDLDKRNFEISFKKINDTGYKTEYDLNYGIEELIKLYKFYVQYVPYNLI